MEENAPAINPATAPAFSLRPDPRGYFPVPSHEPVWNILRTATTMGRGMIVILGDAGSGKTLLIQRLVNVLPEERKGVLLHHPDCPNKRFLRNLISAIRPPGDDPPSAEDPTPETLAQAVEERAAHSHKLLVAVDDAHRLSQENLQTLSLLLTNVEDEDQPVQLLLVGRSELQELIASSALETLSRAVTGTAILTPLTLAEQRAYATHLLQRIAPAKVEISWLAWQGIHLFCGGIPGRINALLNACLRLAMEEEKNGAGLRIGSAIFHKAALPLDGNQSYRRAWRWPALAMAILLSVGVTGLLAGRAMAPVQEKLVLVASSSVAPEAAPTPAAEPAPRQESREPATRKEEPAKAAAAPRVAAPVMQPPGIALALSRQDPFTKSSGSAQTSAAAEPPPLAAGKPPAAPEPPKEVKTPPAPAEASPAPAVTPETEKTATKPPAKSMAKGSDEGSGSKGKEKGVPEKSVAEKSNAEKGGTEKSPSKTVKKEGAKTEAAASYILQAGAYGTKEFAEGVAKRLSALGYHPSIRETSKDGRRFHAVRIPFPDQASTQQAADKIREKEPLVPLLVIPPPAPKR